MKAIKFSIMALAIACTGVTVQAQTLTADQVLQKHIDAVGGIDNWNKIKTVKLVGSMSQQGMEIGMTETRVTGKAMRVDISAMGQNGYMIYTTTEGWMYMPFMGQKEPTALPADQLKGAQEQLNFKNNQLVDKALITKVALDGTDTISNMPCYKLKVTNKDGSEQMCYIDTKTFYLIRAEKKAQVQGEDQEVAVTFSNFVKQPEGIVIPMMMNAAGQGDITFKSVEFNKTIDDKTFRPDGK